MTPVTHPMILRPTSPRISNSQAGSIFTLLESCAATSPHAREIRAGAIAAYLKRYLSLLKNRLRAIEWQKRVVALTSEVKRRDVRSDNEDRPLPGRR
jgi:hypothetical protein